MNTLKISHISKEFKLSRKQRITNRTTKTHIVAVNDVSFELVEGAIYGLVGPNGAGKTTTLRIIASLIKAKTGNVLFNDKDIYDDLSSYRQKVGFLTSELKLDDFFTPEETFIYMSKLYDMDDQLINEKKEELFALFNINKFKDVKIKELSTGMKQKVSLAISLCHDPEIIIFDEPTNGLDVLASKEVENFLLNMKTQNKIILISTHIFSLVEKLCDKVGIILKGKMVYENDMDVIKKDGGIENIFFSLAKEEEI